MQRTYIITQKHLYFIIVIHCLPNCAKIRSQCRKSSVNRVFFRQLISSLTNIDKYIDIFRSNS